MKQLHMNYKLSLALYKMSISPKCVLEKFPVQLETNKFVDGNLLPPQLLPQLALFNPNEAKQEYSVPEFSTIPLERSRSSSSMRSVHSNPDDRKSNEKKVLISPSPRTPSSTINKKGVAYDKSGGDMRYSNSNTPR